MSTLPKFAGVLRLMVLAVAVVFTSLALVVGRSAAVVAPAPETGEVATQDYIATETIDIVDIAATEAERSRAAANVPTIYATDQDVTLTVLGEVARFFSDVREAAQPIPPGEDPTIPSTEPTTTTTTTTSIPDEGETTTTSSTTTTTTTTLPPTTTTLPRPEIETQLETLRLDHPQLDEETLLTMVEVFNEDFDRVEEGEAPVFNAVEEYALGWVDDLLTDGGGILAGELAEVKTAILTEPRRAVIPGLSQELRNRIEAAGADVVVANLNSNRRIDSAAWETEQELARESVPDVTVVYQKDEKIVGAGEIVSQVHRDAIIELELAVPPEGPRLQALALVAALVALLTTAFLWRVASHRLAHPKLMALFGLLVVLAAVISRVPELAVDAQLEFGFLVPASVIGYLAAILFDPRTAALMVLPVGAFTALASGDLAFAVFAAAAALAPVPLVSAVSSRAQLRLAVAYSALALAPVAASIAWFFHGPDRALWAGFYGFANGIVSGVVALGVLPFLESLFRITTNLTLLDLTDRNHPALHLIEEKAPGTFNHSMLVGTLSGKAARAIGANPLLAQAASYYHDLGKTVRPQYFVENQFGVTNPHDYMSPEDSSKVIRAHVSDGLKLARQYRIPEEVSQGILMHHGTGLMRFFYHKALDVDPGDVDAAQYRHSGVKPQSKEMAILMLSDAVEGATRAMVQTEDPTPEGIRKLVEQIVSEKVEDGQLDDSAVTFGELTKIKEALVEALVGYYHRRIPYPGFPGSEPLPGTAVSDMSRESPAGE